jgi:hypothetical protein
MDESSTLTDALLAAGAIVIFFYVVVRCLHRVVVWARRRSKRAYVIGAALAPFMALGNVSDPDFRILHEAKRVKNREDDDSGDPPGSEDERIVRTAAEIAAKKGDNAVRKEDVVAVAARPTRPALVWLISIVLGLMAFVTSLVLAWFLFAEPLLAPQAGFARESLSAFDWASLFVMSVTLLTSMVMLFRLRKSSVHLFALYVALGMLGAAWYALTPEQEPHFDVGVTLFVGMPVALSVLFYMFRLKKRAVLA